MSETERLAAEGQIRIPMRIREELRPQPGDRLDIELAWGGLLDHGGEESVRVSAESASGFDGGGLPNGVIKPLKAANLIDP